MRRIVVAAALLVGALGVTAHSDLLPLTGIAAAAQDPAPPPSAPRAEPAQPATQPAPSPPASSQPAPQVNVEVRDSGWHASPTWIAIGAIGLAVLILVVAMASRTGSNTVIRG